MTTPYCPDMAEFIWIDFNPQAGREQAGRRPALVLSPAAYNRKVGLCVVCPITSQAKGYSFEVAIPPGQRVTGVVLADQVKSMSWQMRNAEFAGAAPKRAVAETRAKLRALLQF